MGRVKSLEAILALALGPWPWIWALALAPTYSIQATYFMQDIQSQTATYPSPFQIKEAWLKRNRTEA